MNGYTYLSANLIKQKKSFYDLIFLIWHLKTKPKCFFILLIPFKQVVLVLKDWFNENDLRTRINDF